MRERQRLLSLNLALLLLFTLLPFPARAAEEGTLPLAGDPSISVGGVECPAGVRAQGTGWRYDGDTLFLSDGYTEEPITAGGGAWLLLDIDGEVVVRGGISGGNIDIECDSVSAALTVYGAEGAPAICASGALSFNQCIYGTLTVIGDGAPALAYSGSLSLPSSRPYDSESRNVILKAGSSGDTAAPITAYHEEPCFFWQVVSYEILFLSQDTVTSRLTLPMTKNVYNEVEYPLPEPEPREGYWFAGWQWGTPLYQPGDVMSHTCPANSSPYRVYTAVWDEIPRTGVVYRGNGAADRQSRAYLVESRPAGPVPLKSQGFLTGNGAVFQGWSLTPDGRPLESLSLSEGDLVTLYAVWKRSNQSGTFAGKALTAEVGVLSVGESLIDCQGMASSQNSGVGWSGRAADLTLTADYAGAPLETAYDLNLHIAGDVTIRGGAGPALSAGGHLTIGFAPGARLTLAGAQGAPAIQAGSLEVQMPGALTAAGGGTAALETAGACRLSSPGADSSGLSNTLLAGPSPDDLSPARDPGDSLCLRLDRPVIHITFDARDSSEPAALPLDYDSPLLLPQPGLERPGFVLLGWYTDPDSPSGARYQPGDPIPFIGDTTLYAQWVQAPDGARAILDGNGGAKADGETYAPAAGLPADAAGFSRSGFVWKGWSLTRSGSPLSQAGFEEAAAPGKPIPLLYALWEAIQFPPSSGQTFGPGDVTLPHKLSNIHYMTTMFNGWNTEPDGTGVWYPYETEIHLEEATVLYPLFVDYAYPLVCLCAWVGAFDGRSFEVVGNELPCTFTLPPSVQDVPVLAWWNESIYNADPGYEPCTAYRPGDQVTQASSTLFRAVFDGENTGDRAWTVQHLNGGTTSDQRGIVVSFASFSSLRLASSQTVLRDGYTLSGWNTREDGAGVTYPAGSRIAKKDLAQAPRELYAMWSYTGTPLASVILRDGDTAETVLASQGGTCTLPTPRKSGFRFAGWSPAPDGSGPLYPGGGTFVPQAERTTLYAQWRLPDLTLPIPPEMAEAGGQIFVALYSGDHRLVAVRQVTPGSDSSGEVTLTDVPADAAAWKLFCLDENCRPLTPAGEGPISSP